MQLSLFLLTHLKIFNEGQRFAYALVCVGFEQIWGSDDIDLELKQVFESQLVSYLLIW